MFFLGNLSVSVSAYGYVSLTVRFRCLEVLVFRQMLKVLQCALPFFHFVNLAGRFRPRLKLPREY